MTTSWQAIFGAVMMGIGAIKTWLHMGTAPLLFLPTCNGETVTIALSNTSWIARAHCWGCYMLAVGLIVVLFATYERLVKRRSVAS